MFFQEAFHTNQGLFKLVVRGTIGTAYVTLTCSTKRTARNNSNLLLEKEILSELLISQTCIPDVRKGIKCASRFTTGQANAIKPIDEHATSASIILMHRLYIILPVAQCL